MRKVSKSRTEDDIVSSTNGSANLETGEQPEKADSDENNVENETAQDDDDLGEKEDNSYDPAKKSTKKKAGRPKSKKSKPEAEYEVEKIIDSKKIKGKLHYLLRWKGYASDNDTWEPANTVSCPDLITKFKEEKENSKSKVEKKTGKKRKASKNKEASPKKRKTNTEWDSENADENAEYEVERILEVHHKKTGKREFLIHWKGWSNKFDSWEPEDNLNCPDLIKKFMDKVESARTSDSRSLRVAPESTSRFTLQPGGGGRRLSKRRGQKQRSARASYGDDAVSYVQLKREGNLCTIKAKICPEHKVHAKLYGVSLVVDEHEETVKSVECHDCVASQGGCKHAMAFLMWVHRRSEEPSCTSIECYWMKSKLSRVGSTLKYITAKELSKGSPSLPSNNDVFEKFLEEGKRRRLTKCELMKYQNEYVLDRLQSLTMDNLVLKYTEKCCDKFLERVIFSDADINYVEEETREQHKSRLWYELRYGRVTASRAYEFSRCKTSDGTLMAIIMGGKIPDTTAMKRGRTLEDDVRKTVSVNLGKKIKTCGLILSKNYPMLAGTPDGICENSVIEIKCPMSEKTVKHYVSNGKPTQKFYVQMQLQMLLTGHKNGYFCVADCNYSTNKKVDIMNVMYDEKYVSDFLKVIVPLWKDNVYPVLYKSVNK